MFDVRYSVAPNSGWLFMMLSRLVRWCWSFAAYSDMLYPTELLGHGLNI